MTRADDDAAVASTTSGQDASPAGRRPAPRRGAVARAQRPGGPRWLAAVDDPAPPTSLAEVVGRADAIGLRRVDLLAWRDLDDPEAGGSELHAHEVASRWAAVGLDVHVQTSAVAGLGAHVHRDGYAVTRRWGRYAVFPRSAMANVRRHPDGLVEIWNGMPFFSPLWARGPRVVFLHHVHGEMWGMTLPWPLAVTGDLIERRLAPVLYRGSRIVTLSGSSREEIVTRLGVDAERVTVVPPGVDERFSPGGRRSAEPLVVAVGRLVPVKRFDRLVEALVEVRRRVPRLRAVIVGEGYERDALERQVVSHGAGGWLDLAGRVDDATLVDLYRRAWVLVSTSQREGWGMTITEAAACGTPAVATRIAGHVDAVEDGRSGVLVDDERALVGAVEGVLRDDAWRLRLGRRALDRARRLTWEATAAGTLDALVGEAAARRRSSAGR